MSVNSTLCQLILTYPQKPGFTLLSIEAALLAMPPLPTSFTPEQGPDAETYPALVQQQQAHQQWNHLIRPALEALLASELIRGQAVDYYAPYLAMNGVDSEQATLEQAIYAKSLFARASLRPRLERVTIDISTGEEIPPAPESE